MQADDTLPRRLGRFLVAALLVISGRSECQQPASQDTAGDDAAQDGCRSIVMVHCAQAQQDTGATAAPADPRRATQQRLDARRLRQMQAQADPWERFSQSVAGAAVPPCFSPNAAPHGSFAAQGLLALPFLLHAAAIGKCQ